MQFLFAHLADSTIVSREGKLSIIGIFSAIHPPMLPCRFPRFDLVLGFQIEYNDAGKKYAVLARLIDSDAKELVAVEGEIDVPADASMFPALQVVQPIDGVVFEKAGSHRLEVSVDGKPCREIELLVSGGLPNIHG